MRPLWAVFPAVLLVCLRGALGHASVPAPENVTVQCEDQMPVVYWNYSSQQPTKFNVSLKGSGTFFSVRTEAHELDLSGRGWLDGMQMFEFLYINITAEQGTVPSRSEWRPSRSFSYNRHKTVNIKCRLKFPPVNLTGEGEELTLSFENPLYFFKELRSIRDSAAFEFKIHTNSETEPLQRRCGPAERVCKFSVSSEDAEPCVNLTGHITKGAEQIAVQHIGPVCATARATAPTTDGLWVVAILVVVVIIIVILLLTYGICKTRAWVFPKIPTPEALIPSGPILRPSVHQPEPVYSSIQIIGTRPRAGEDPESPSPDSVLVPTEDQALILPPGYSEYHDESGNSTQTDTLSLHSTDSEAEVSNYERRPELLQMDVSGDLVTGYTG
uniref:Fibronectin type-III domain-containing protein n=1 Tax=Neogobius melanostomus TaxID=47308 RepID=A0A8C6TRH0_9GOBI